MGGTMNSKVVVLFLSIGTVFAGCGNNCSSCPNEKSCTNGKAKNSCAWCSNSCTNVQTNVKNCGSCGTACVTPNGTPSCVGSVCTIKSCNPGFADCDGNPSNGCEVSLSNDVNNCGSCGTLCATPNGTPSCVGSVCTIKSCNPGFADCDGNPSNGCEVSLSNDVNNCGGCGTACVTPNGTPSCVGSVCTIGSCNPGFADCNGNPGDGCEVSLSNDFNNCGACGNSCGDYDDYNGVVDDACSNGACIELGNG